MTGAVSTLALVVAVSRVGSAALVGAQSVARSVPLGRHCAVAGAAAGVDLLLAVVFVLSLAGGQHPCESRPHPAYLVASVAGVPLAVSLSAATTGAGGKLSSLARCSWRR